MAELTQSCPDLQGVFDLAALIRMHNRPLSAAIGQVKEMSRKSAFVPLDQREDARQKLIEAIADKKIIQADFENNLQIIYAATCFQEIPQEFYALLVTIQFFKKMEMRLPQNLHSRISNLPCLTAKEPWTICFPAIDPSMSLVFSSVWWSLPFPFFGGHLLTYLSHQQPGCCDFSKNYTADRVIFLLSLIHRKNLA